MKRLIHLVLFLSIFSTAFSQIDELVFFQVGGTLGADVAMLSGKIGDQSFNSTNINYATLILTGRINVLEGSNNFSVSLGTQPAISFGGIRGDVSGATTTLRIPAIFELNFNAASTVSTRKDVGFSFGGGIQYTRYPLGNSGAPVLSDGDVRDPGFFEVKSSWWEPVAVVGVKFFGKHYYCREINLRASFASIDVLNEDSDAVFQVVDFRSTGIMLSFLQYLNY